MVPIRDDETLAELAEQYDVHPNQIQDWKKRLMVDACGAIGLRSPVNGATSLSDALQQSGRHFEQRILVGLRCNQRQLLVDATYLIEEMRQA